MQDSTEIERIVFVGAGNVATHLSTALQQAGFIVRQIFSRTTDAAQRLARQLHCDWTTDLKTIDRNADLYIFAVTDDVLPELISRIQANNALWIHTAGSVSMDVFKGHVRHYGVLYPLQTFSRNRETDFGSIPCFVEAAIPEDEARLYSVARQLSKHVYALASEKRKYVHLAAVFANNFSNHMYVLAARILREQGLSPDILLPLIDETAAKIHTLSPAEAQTGPAVRHDQDVSERQEALLTDPTMKEIYQLITRNISNESMYE